MFNGNNDRVKCNQCKRQICSCVDMEFGSILTLQNPNNLFKEAEHFCSWSCLNRYTTYKANEERNKELADFRANQFKEEKK